MTHGELKELFRDADYDTILADLYKRGRSCGVDGLRVVTDKQLNNATDRATQRIVTENDLTTYSWGDYSCFRTPEFRMLVISKK